MKKLLQLSETDTHVYIDVSNIRWACLWSCGFSLDFIKLYNYFKSKYVNLREVRYYEGIELADEKKKRHFKFLEKRVGYKVCSLERKGYWSRLSVVALNVRDVGRKIRCRFCRGQLR